ncbi:hypothetical protein EV356DRAFT_577501 [Viridothelium virens]|uniref:SnoaL-like domain-containing protein n=1 Tax=Viridothelium virens TaxID=1048519 RepID=A0A6A6H5U1_VIRVR|nr:hypothetical protein EV356DRAFT_577501 [Viridothelium virens]
MSQPSTTAAASAAEYEAIRNTVARYCFAIDDKDWNSLSLIFTPDADAEYPFPGGSLKGVKAMKDTIRKRLENVTSHHALTTQTIDIDAGDQTAKAKTYFTGTHFGKNDQQGKSSTAYGMYVDELEVVEGFWRIRRRECIIKNRVGNEDVFQPTI